MLRTRVIPVLLLKEGGLYKTMKFKDPVYIGDPLNCVKIFNEKEVDELVFLDIEPCRSKSSPNFDFIAMIASECFMPFAYGGGIRSLDDIQKILRLGAEKVVINSHVFEDQVFLSEAIKQFGSQSIVISLDIRRSLFGSYELYSHGGTRKQATNLVDFITNMQSLGVGELFINHIDREGTQKGYDINLIKEISLMTTLPIVACGGAKNLADFAEAVNAGGASAVAAGSLFVFHGKHRAVLITYPTQTELREHLN